MAKLDKSEKLIDAGLAIKIGELLCEALYGDLSRQRPLSASDRESYWRVEGSWNPHGNVEGLAGFFLSIAKSDGCVTEVGEAMRVAPHPSIEGLFSTPNAQMEGEGINPEMSAQCMMILTNLGRGGLVFSEDLALKLGELFCEARYGDVLRQVPLRVTDKNAYWHVEGNWNKDHKISGAGPFFVSIDKCDGRVTEIGE